MNIDVLSVKDKVQRYLTEFYEQVGVDNDGDFSFRIGSTHLWVRVSEVKSTEQLAGYVSVRVFANTNNKVPPSAALYEYVATEGQYGFGSLRCFKKDDGVRIFLGHTLMGDFLDPMELGICFSHLAKTADWLDDVIKSKFGGVLYYEGSN